MPIYTIAVTFAIGISAVIMFLIFSRLKLLDFRILLSVTLASLISAIALPGIFNIISVNKNGAVEVATLLPVTIASIAIYVMLAFILSMIVSCTIPRLGIKSEASEFQVSEAISSEVGTAGKDYLEQIYNNLVNDNSRETTNNAENMNKVENNLEKSVDSTENIDKMGIENIVQESEILTIEECIEEAFRLKEQGDAEGAILYCMYALDKKPRKELAFWIVLDICVMYKTLGQYELAFDILNSYYDVFGDIMDVSVREEIEDNLSGIQA